MIWIAIIIVCFGLGALFGAPYLPVLGRDVDSLIELADLKPGQHLIDLGSGDGKLLKAAAKKGIRATGFEINPIMWLVSIVYCWPYRKLVNIHLANFWQVRLPAADAIYVFLITHHMERLDQKLQKEIKQPTKLVSYVFEIPGRKPVHSTKNSYVYTYPNS